MKDLFSIKSEMKFPLQKIAKVVFVDKTELPGLGFLRIYRVGMIDRPIQIQKASLDE